MKRFGWIVISAFCISFCCACHAVTPGPSTTRSSAAAVIVEEETTEAATEAAESTEAMTETETTQAVQGQTMRATTEVNIRSEASKDAEVVGGLEEGETITVIGTEGKWSIVMVDGQQCYVYSKYLEAAE